MNRLLLSATLLATAAVAGGAVRPITLDQAIITARTGSVEAAVALNELRTAYWEYRTFRADLLPEVSFNATAPSYRKNYTPYQLEDGSYTFVRNNMLELRGNVSVEQNIWLTGGKLSLTTSLDYLRGLDSGGFNRYMSVPVALTLSQPLFGTNHTKWNRRIEPVRYEEAKASFISATEEVAMRAVDYFFSLLMAKENLATARLNLENARKLHEVAKAKRAMGQISENDLLQLELNLLTARSTETDMESNYRSAMFQLQSFL
ncbi:MAG: TolC family protein, partial [Muribaculaceae bacterium]|nr:TolC family protein [Muribaculaceae bacterium]